jgi:hypothetical protein
LAKSLNIKSEFTGFINRRTPLPMVGYQEDLLAEIFNLSKSNPYPESVYENKDGAFIFRWEDYEGVDPDQYKKDKNEFLRTMMENKQGEIFQNWLQELIEKAEIEKDLSLL